jgi:hypothetical protein
MSVIHLADRRDNESALREQFLSLAGQTFDFVAAVVAARRSPAPAPFEPPLKTAEAARRLNMSPSSLRERVRNGQMKHAVVSTSGALKFSATVINAIASGSPLTH